MGRPATGIRAGQHADRRIMPAPLLLGKNAYAPTIEVFPANLAEVPGATGGLTSRDAETLAILDSHRALTALQLARLLFPSYDRARHRLVELHRRGVLARFRHRLATGTQPWRYTLGHVGSTIIAATGQAVLPKPSKSTEKILRLAHSPHTEHLLGVNDFFTTLAGHARRDGQCELRRWEPERVVADACGGIVAPDAYGEWTDRQNGTTLSFFYEHDTGSEPISTLVDKIGKYRDLARTGIRRPVLIRLHSTTRETHLRDAIQRRWADGAPIQVATVAADRLAPDGHDIPPTRPCLPDAVWLPEGRGDRHSLIDLARPGVLR